MSRWHCIRANRSGKSPLSRWIITLKRTHIEPLFEVVEECQRDIITAREIFWIDYYRDRGEASLNVIRGGGLFATFTKAIRFPEAPHLLECQSCLGLIWAYPPLFTPTKRCRHCRIFLDQDHDTHIGIRRTTGESILLTREQHASYNPTQPIPLERIPWACPGLTGPDTETTVYYFLMLDKLSVIEEWDMTGEELYQLRKSSGLSQADLAKSLGTWTNTVARWEREERSISEPMVRLIKIICKQAKKNRSSP